MKKVSALQTTPGTVLDVNVTLVTKEYRVVSVENLVPIGTGDTSFLLFGIISSQFAAAKVSYISYNK